MCGVMMTFGRLQSGWPGGSGSGSVTSRPAPPIEPCDQRRREIGRHDALPSPDVDEVGAVPHRGEERGVEHAARLGRQRRRVDDDVGARRERAVLVGEADVLDVVGPFAAAVARRDHVQPQPVRAFRDFRADAAQADDEQRLAFDLDRPLGAQLAKAARERAGVLLLRVDRQRPREREHQRDPVLGHVRPLDALQVRDEDAALGDGRDRRAAIRTRVQQLNPFEARAARDDLRRAEADQHVGARDDLRHAGEVAQARDADDLDAGRERTQRVGERHVGDDDFLRSAASRRSRAPAPRLRAARSARRARPRLGTASRSRRQSAQRRAARTQKAAAGNIAKNERQRRP